MADARPPSKTSDARPASSSSARAMRGLGRMVERLGAVMEIGRALGSTRDLDALLRLVMDRTTSLLDAERSTLFLVDAARGELWSKIAQGAGAEMIRMPLEMGVAGWVARNGQTLTLDDPYTDPRFNPEVDRQTGFRTRSLVAAPLRGPDDKVLGVVQVLNRREGTFDAADRALLEALAGQAAVAIQNAQSYLELETRHLELQKAQSARDALIRELDVLFDIEQRISAAPSTDAVLEAILERALDLTRSQAGALLLVSEGEAADGELLFRAALGGQHEAVKRLTVPAGQGIAGQVARTGQPIVSNVLERDARFDASIALRVGYRPKRALVVPVNLEGRTIGALELLDKRENYEEGDLRLATLIAGQTARAITLGKGRDEADRQTRLSVIGQMMSSVLHDLRTPMTVISGYSQLLIDDGEVDSRREAVEAIQRQTAHIDAMVKETLAFARGERSLLLRTVHLNRFLDDLAQLLAKEFEGRNVVLSMPPGYRGSARFDENKLRRLVFNIARNAAQAMPAGGSFSLTTALVGETDLRFDFSDTGPGIPAEVGRRLFERFVSHGKPEGTGLGLAIVKEIAVAHGGSVSFSSELGKGTTFSVLLPGAAQGS